MFDSGAKNRIILIINGIIYGTSPKFCSGVGGELKKRTKCDRMSGLRVILDPGTSQIRSRSANHSKMRLGCSEIGE
jgi:hypothetical protein